MTKVKDSKVTLSATGLYNNTISFTLGTEYQYNGKEKMQHLYDYGARWYYPSIGRFIGVDPLADSYPGMSPYGYVLNNPLQFTDPTGMAPDKIIIKGNKGKKTEYKAGMKYNGDDTFTGTMVNQFNKMYNTDGGKEVLCAMITSKANYVYTNEKTKNGTVAFTENKTGKGGTVYLGNSTDLKSVAHESFHGYQTEMGQGGRSINNEIGAYLYATSLYMNYSFSNGLGAASSGTLWGNGTKQGKLYSNAIRNLLWNKSFNSKYFIQAVRSFKGGAQTQGLYNDYPILKQQRRPLISGFYPLIK